MKHLAALFCAALIVTNTPNALANDVPLPERKPAYQHAVLDQESLVEARHILEKISLQLKDPALEQPAQTQAIQPDETLAGITPDDDEIRAEDLSISKIGDTELSCGGLSSEAGNMRDIIFTTQDIKDSARMQSHGITAAGALGSFLVGTVTGGVGLAVGGFLLDQNVGKTEREADALQDTAAQRRTLMMGIFNAKGCEGPLEHAMQNPEIFDPLGNIAAIETSAGDQPNGQYNN